MRKAIFQVEEFHRAMGLPVGDSRAPAFSRTTLRVDLIEEELDELKVAIEAQDLVAASDALADLAYVVLGAAVEWGLPLPPVFDEVHRSNMAKVGGPKREDGKQLKPPGWTPPDIAGVLARAKEGRW
jgi:predicted HAD superfamily Cof-like phosphohydrolase